MNASDDTGDDADQHDGTTGSESGAGANDSSGGLGATATRSSDGSANSEARESPREHMVTTVRVELTDPHVAGTTRNVSSNGLLLVTGDALEVAIEYLDGEQPVSRRGRIVRVQGLAGDTLGIAIAFDSES
ncbi:hypothetical protein Pla163_26200 [Planctomycetes bacterium Pla163]|uniref:PilZ domain-containing protein n=1 Tax=Rohdeia mirabilis TaxID=2528008 RepID=A0A518D207_9BACT|nr:hypothetical protein Pla163_26200 [Planctomycetes bacterium Pla163]